MSSPYFISSNKCMLYSITSIFYIFQLIFTKSTLSRGVWIIALGIGGNGKLNLQLRWSFFLHVLACLWVCKFIKSTNCLYMARSRPQKFYHFIIAEIIREKNAKALRICCLMSFSVLVLQVFKQQFFLSQLTASVVKQKLRYIVEWHLTPWHGMLRYSKHSKHDI